MRCSALTDRKKNALEKKKRERGEKREGTLESPSHEGIQWADVRIEACAARGSSQVHQVHSWLMEDTITGWSLRTPRWTQTLKETSVHRRPTPEKAAEPVYARLLFPTPEPIATQKR